MTPASGFPGCRLAPTRTPGPRRLRQAGAFVAEGKEKGSGQRPAAARGWRLAVPAGRLPGGEYLAQHGATNHHAVAVGRVRLTHRASAAGICGGPRRPAQTYPAAGRRVQNPGSSKRWLCGDGERSHSKAARIPQGTVSRQWFGESTYGAAAERVAVTVSVSTCPHCPLSTLMFVLDQS